MTQVALPSPTARFTPARKETVVRAVRRGEITLVDALSTYGLSAEEFAGWVDRFDRHGQRGLATTRTQECR